MYICRNKYGAGITCILTFIFNVIFFGNRGEFFSSVKGRVGFWTWYLKSLGSVLFEDKLIEMFLKKKYKKSCIILQFSFKCMIQII